MALHPFDARFASRRPPRHLEVLHAPAVVDRERARIESTVRTPAVRLHGPPSERAVHVLDTALFVIEGGGAIHAVLTDPDSDDVGIGWLPDDAVSLDPCPFGWIWLSHLEKRFARRLSARLGHPDHEAHPLAVEYARWAYMGLRRHVAAHFDMREVRERVRSAIAPDPAVVRVARRVRRRPLTTGQRMLRLGDYNHVLADWTSYRVLAAEASHLLPLYSALHARQAREAGTQPVQRLKAAVRAAGLSEATWRLVANGGPRLLDPVSRFYNSSIEDAVINYLHALQALKLRTEPPRWLIEQTLSLFGNPERRSSHYAMHFEKCSPFIEPDKRIFARVLARVLRMGDAARERRGEIQRVLDWAADADVQLDAARQRAGWAWMSRSAERWDAQRRLRAHGGAAWTVPFERMEVDGVVVEALSSALALWKEGHEMRHCAGRLAGAASLGDLVLALQAGSRRSRRATALLRKDRGRWRVHQVVGFANREGPAWAKAATARVAVWLNANARPGSPLSAGTPR